MPTSSKSPARLWHAVTALALVVGVVFLTRGPETDAGGIPFKCGGLQVKVIPGDEGALLTAGTQVFELHLTRTADGRMLHHGLGLGMLLAGSVPTFLLVHRLRGHAQCGRGGKGAESHDAVGNRARTARGNCPLHRRSGDGRLRDPVPGVRWARPVAARESHSGGRPLAAPSDLRLRDLVRGEQHGPHQLHHGLAAALRHGAAGIDAGGARAVFTPRGGRRMSPFWSCWRS
jgi:hypothetical protein